MSAIGNRALNALKEAFKSPEGFEECKKVQEELTKATANSSVDNSVTGETRIQEDRPLKEIYSNWSKWAKFEYWEKDDNF